MENINIEIPKSENYPNWNYLETKTDNYWKTFEYSEKFDDMFSSISGETSHLRLNPTEKVSTKLAKAIRDKYKELEYKLSTKQIILDTQNKADAILNELYDVLKYLK